MTLTTENPTRSLDLQVRLDPAGKPLAIRHDGRIWIVDPATESRHWFARDPERGARRTATAGGGDVVSIEYWRVEARLASNSALRAFTLRRNPRSVQWLLDDISDGD